MLLSQEGNTAVTVSFREQSKLFFWNIPSEMGIEQPNNMYLCIVKRIFLTLKINSVLIIIKFFKEKFILRILVYPLKQFMKVNL